jgi:hypothetical protein
MTPEEAKHRQLTVVRAQAYAELFGRNPVTFFPAHSVSRFPKRSARSSRSRVPTPCWIACKRQVCPGSSTKPTAPRLSSSWEAETLLIRVKMPPPFSEIPATARQVRARAPRWERSINWSAEWPSPFLPISPRGKAGRGRLARSECAP